MESLGKIGTAKEGAKPGITSGKKGSTKELRAGETATSDRAGDDEEGSAPAPPTAFSGGVRWEQAP